MAIIWAEGFDHYGNTPNGGRDAMLAGAWAAFSWGNGNPPAVSAVRARTGLNSLLIDYNFFATAGVQCRRVLGTSHIIVGMAAGWYFNSLPDTNKVHGFEFRNNANACIAFFAIQSDGAIGFYSGSGRTIIASSDPVITANSWQHIEAKIICDTVVGQVEVRVNGIVVLNVTGINLGSLGSTQIVFGMPADDLGSSLIYYIDDVVTWNDDGLSNNTFLGQQRVQTLLVDGDTAAADWTKVGAVTGFDCIDNVPPDGDTSYLSGGTLNAVSEFTLPDLPPETSAIVGVYVPMMARLDDAGTGSAQASLVSGAAVSLGPDQPLTTAYTYWGGVHQLDPATALPWSKAGLEAAKLRIKKTA